MRILSVAGSLTHGGAETVMTELVRGLAEHQHRVIHSTAARGIRPHGPFLRELARAGASSADVPLDRLSSGDDRASLLGGFDPDVVLVHWWGRDLLRSWIDDAAAAGCHRRPRFVCVVHCSGISPPRGYDRYVLVARSQRRWIAALPPDRVRVIPNGVDLTRFRFVPRPPRRDRRMVVGRLSRLTADKIPADWVRTAAAYDLPETRWVIAGAGPLRRRLRTDVAALGFDDRFSLPGYVRRARVPSLLASFDVFCHVTATAVESSPLALLEALAAGVPIVAEARGGIPEIVADGVNGLLASSPDEIGRQLHALRDVRLRLRLARGARRTALAFSLARQLAGYRELLAAIEREREAADSREARVAAGPAHR